MHSRWINHSSAVSRGLAANTVKFQRRDGDRPCDGQSAARFLVTLRKELGFVLHRIRHREREAIDELGVWRVTTRATAHWHDASLPSRRTWPRNEQSVIAVL